MIRDSCVQGKMYALGTIFSNFVPNMTLLTTVKICAKVKQIS